MLIPNLILQQSSIKIINIFSQPIGSSGNRTKEQEELASTEFNEFIKNLEGKSTLLFCDGSVEGRCILGDGGCGTVLVPLDEDSGILVESKWVGSFVDNVTCEIEGVVNSMSIAYHHLNNTNDRKEEETIFIFVDCVSAIDVVGKQKDVQKWYEVLERVWKWSLMLREIKVSVCLAWIPGHAGIHYNDLADNAAKLGCKMRPEKIQLAEINMETALKLVKELSLKAWQTSWLRSDSGSFTKGFIPLVGRRMRFPKHRTVAISYIRCLLNNAAVAENFHRMKFEESPNCDCGNDRESVEHVLLKCEKFDFARRIWTLKMEQLWLASKKKGNLDVNLQLLLNPAETGKFINEEIKSVLHASFMFFKNIKAL